LNVTRGEEKKMKALVLGGGIKTNKNLHQTLRIIVSGDSVVEFLEELNMQTSEKLIDL